MGGAGLFGLIFSGLAGIFLLAGIHFARQQARKLATFRPVPAKVISSGVLSTTADEGESSGHTPDIRYTYTTGGKTYETNTVLASGNNGTGGLAWAEQVVEQYPDGTTTTAYIDPADPSKAFLIREASVGPYVFILFPMIHFCVGLAVLLGAGSKPYLSGAPLAMLIALVWNGAGIACLFHYKASGGAMRLGARVGFILYCGVGLIMLVTASDLAAEKKVAKLTRAAPTVEQTPVEGP